MAIAEKAHHVKSVARDELKAKIDRKDPLTIVEALAPEQFRHAHLPGAVNVPPDRVDELAPALLPNKQREVVVYCANVTCHASGDVARALTALGYTNVGHYAAGKADWMAAGLPVETLRMEPTPWYRRRGSLCAWPQLCLRRSRP